MSRRHQKGPVRRPPPQPIEAGADGTQAAQIKPQPRDTPRDAGGFGQYVVFAGWFLPGAAALVSGLVLWLVTGDVDPLVAAVVAGALVGWASSLVLLFTVGSWLERRGWRQRPSDGFETPFFIWGVAVGIAMAVLAWIDRPLAGLITVVVVGAVILLVIASFIWFVLTDR